MRGEEEEFVEMFEWEGFAILIEFFEEFERLARGKDEFFFEFWGMVLLLDVKFCSELLL